LKGYFEAGERERLVKKGRVKGKAGKDGKKHRS